MNLSRMLLATGFEETGLTLGQLERFVKYAIDDEGVPLNHEVVALTTDGRIVSLTVELRTDY